MAFERRLVGALGFALLVLSSKGLAQPSPAKRETARELMVEARQLRDRGDLEGALTRFSAADAIMSVPTTALEVATTQAELGKLVEARESLLRMLGTPPGPGDPEPFNEARANARVLSQQLLARIGSIVFSASVSEADELDLRIDGERVPRAMLGLRFRVNPGKHQLVARSGGRELWRELEVAEGQVLSTALNFEQQPLASEKLECPTDVPPAKLDTQAPTPSSSTSRSTPQRALRVAGRNDRQRDAGRGEASSTPSLVYVGASVGALGITVGTVSGISAILQKNAVEKGCVKGACPPSTWHDLQTAHNLATASNVGFVIGGVGLALLGGSLLWDRPARPRRAWVVTPEMSRQGASVSLAGKF